jgi:protein-S-isoprenylcysteine O-methyltransferase Ste14
MIWLKVLLFTLVVPGTTLALVPYWILASGAGSRLSLGAFRWLGLLPLLAGIAGLASCYTAFAVVGSGTPSPLDPPKTLVGGGLYRFLRNPIYVSAALVLVGEALLWEAPAWRSTRRPSSSSRWTLLRARGDIRLSRLAASNWTRPVHHRVPLMTPIR